MSPDSGSPPNPRLKLRAATDLGRLWYEEGRGKAASELVTGVVSRFEEGWGTADLKAATALLAELAPEVEEPALALGERLVNAIALKDEG